MPDFASSELRTITDADADAIAERVAKLILAASNPHGERIEPGAVYSLREACALVQMHPNTMRKKFRVGVIKARNKGRWRVAGSELLKLA